MKLPVLTTHDVILLAAGINALAGAWLAYRFFNSRWWCEMVVDPKTGRAVAGDVMKAFSFAMAMALSIAITVAKLAYGREIGLEIPALIALLLTYSFGLQDNKRRRLQAAANTDTDAPKPPAES
ncbi:hypothetical protein DNI29_04530 [Hymenobacter sediminis]|uniref:hypothetical protein n=1 Tax=Hymenobacter sediminis TaxID=2218621 RepID=UPI000DA64D7B|nr:hypothetical protein [Hymenobacter sediminis]RPD50069.1 hypothetical protein DNI29_04530 [Hymenobacter sediminis]